MNRRRATSRRPAFSLIESAIAMGILSIVLVALLNMIGMAAKNRTVLSHTFDAQLLAQELMDEILLMPYEDPNETVSFGREATEPGLDRSQFDDVDDYDGWNADQTKPPQGRDGTPRPGLTGWTRSVTVDHVDPGALDTSGSSSDGIKRITVTVHHEGRQRASLTMIMTESWQGAAHG